MLSGERSAVCAREAHLLLASQQGHEYSLLCCASMYLGLYNAYQVARDWVGERGRQGAGGRVYRSRTGAGPDIGAPRSDP